MLIHFLNFNLALTHVAIYKETWPKRLHHYNSIIMAKSNQLSIKARVQIAILRLLSKTYCQQVEDF